jgi:hypothetical protein
MGAADMASSRLYWATFPEISLVYERALPVPP